MEVTDSSHHPQEHVDTFCRNVESEQQRLWPRSMHVFPWRTSLAAQAFYFSCNLQRGCTPGLLQQRGEASLLSEQKHVKNTPTSSYKAARIDKQQW